MVVVLVKEVRLVIVVDGLDFKIKDVTFEAKVFNRYNTFDQIANKGMEDHGLECLWNLFDYFERLWKTLFAMIWQFGPPMFFVT